MAITFNDWTLYEEENKLQHGKQDIPLQPLCVKALSLFAENAGQVVSRETLINKVWNGRIVSEDAINNCVKKIRKALGDNSKNPSILETIPKKGYRLLVNSAQNQSVKTSIYKKKPLIWLMSIILLATSLMAISAKYPVSVEVIQISSDMSEAEKQSRYNRIIERTQNGGHLIKFDITTTKKSSLPKESLAKQTVDKK